VVVDGLMGGGGVGHGGDCTVFLKVSWVVWRMSYGLFSCLHGLSVVEEGEV